MKTTVKLRLLLIVTLLGTVDAMNVSGVTFYRVQGNRCLSKIAPLQTFTDNQMTVSKCMLQCYENAQCAALQLIPQQGKCNIYQTISHDAYLANSVAASAGTCIIYNRRCPQGNLYYNFTTMYWNSKATSIIGTYWYSDRIKCWNQRLDLLVIGTQQMLTYMGANPLKANGCWYIGGSMINSSVPAIWVDGTSVGITYSRPQTYCSCTAPTTQKCFLFSANYSGVVYSSCNCSFAMLCGCYEWSQIAQKAI